MNKNRGENIHENQTARECVCVCICVKREEFNNKRAMNKLWRVDCNKQKTQKRKRIVFSETQEEAMGVNY